MGVGFMVGPGSHGGAVRRRVRVLALGTHHFADRDGIGVYRTVVTGTGTGTGFVGPIPSPWRETYESAETCPDELLLFFHHVPHAHMLRSAKTAI